MSALVTHNIVLAAIFRAHEETSHIDATSVPTYTFIPSAVIHVVFAKWNEHNDETNEGIDESSSERKDIK